jgi:hypothetical protein
LEYYNTSNTMTQADTVYSHLCRELLDYGVVESTTHKRGVGLDNDVVLPTIFDDGFLLAERM